MKRRRELQIGITDGLGVNCHALGAYVLGACAKGVDDENPRASVDVALVFFSDASTEAEYNHSGRNSY